MKGVRFYLEHKSPAHKRRGEHEGNVFAAFVCNGRYNGLYEGLGAVYYHPNSVVASTSADIRGFLGRLCKRIPEKLAREIHPALFERLDKERLDKE